MTYYCKVFKVLWCWAPFRVYFHVTYQACWWFPALFRLLIIAKLSVEILFASYRAKAQHREKLLGVVSPACFTPTVRSLATRPFCGKKKNMTQTLYFYWFRWYRKLPVSHFPSPSPYLWSVFPPIPKLAVEASAEPSEKSSGYGKRVLLYYPNSWNLHI